MASAPAQATGSNGVIAPFEGRKRMLATIVLVVSNFMVILDMTVANVSIPHIAGSLGVSTDQGTWVITSYAVAEAISVPLTGWLVQRFGTVRTYVIAMTGFASFSFLCGISVTMQMIVVCRIGQGLCGGLIMPLSQTLLLRIYPKDQIAKAMLMWTMTVLLGPATGPIVGGYISEEWSWHWIFLINIPIAAVLVTSGYVLLKPVETAIRKVPIDRVGLVLLVFWVGCLQIMLDIGRQHDWFGDPLIVMLAIGAGVGFIAFLIWELTEEHPVVDLRVFRHRGFTFGVLALSLCFGAYFASIVMIPQWLQAWMGYPAMLAGFVAAGTAIAAISTAFLASRAMSWADPRLMVSGAVTWLGCMALVRANWTNGADLYWIAMPQFVQGFGMSFFMLPLTTISLSAVDPEETASAAGMQNFVRTVSLAMATALALTEWEDTQRVARTEIVDKLQPEETLAKLQDAGFSLQEATAFIAQIVQREAVVMAVDHVFYVTAAVFFLSAAVIWLAPRPAKLPPPGAGAH
jgi:DHA2 family multidrug resistance protein